MAIPLLLDRFVARLPEPQQANIEQRDRLEQVLAGALALGREAWPELAVTDEAYVDLLAARTPERGAPELELGKLCLDDLYLVCACLTGDARALKAFEAYCFPSVDHALARLRQSRATSEELKQGLREQLFVGEGGGPLLRTYSGRGRLRSWLRIIAVRTAGRLIDQERKEVLLTDSVLGGLGPAEDDPELELLKATYRREFGAAFAEALATLDDRERTLLAQHYVDRLSIDEIGVIYGAHRATIARWLAKARERVLQQTRATLMRKIRVGEGEYESIMRLIESQLPLQLPLAGSGGEDAEGGG